MRNTIAAHAHSTLLRTYHKISSKVGIFFNAMQRTKTGAGEIDAMLGDQHLARVACALITRKLQDPYSALNNEHDVSVREKFEDILKTLEEFHTSNSLDIDLQLRAGKALHTLIDYRDFLWM